MSDARESRHLPPEVFVDVLENAPVDASWRNHLGSCAHCRAELEELRTALTWARSDALEEAPSEAAPAVEATPRRARVHAGYWVAAAALVLSVLFVYRDSGLDLPGPAATTELQELLPPIEQDEEFQWIVGLTDSLELDPSLGPEAPLSELVPDTDELTSDQREELLDRLAEEMRASS